jgi:hypothetical protein
MNLEPTQEGSGPLQSPAEGGEKKKLSKFKVNLKTDKEAE